MSEELDIDDSIDYPSFTKALLFWCKLGLISFGGPAGQIAIMHKELVEVKRWISEQHFLDALNFTMLLPGPEAQQLATYLGWRLHGVRGGIAAGGLFVLPSMILLFFLSWLFVIGQDVPWLLAFFHGLFAAVVALIVHAVIKIGGKVLRSPLLVFLALVSFGAIFFYGVSFVWIVLSMAVVGYFGYMVFPNQFSSKEGQRQKADSRSALKLRQLPRGGWMRVARISAICLVLWWLPVFILAELWGWDSTPAQQGVFFSKAAMVTLGGAYAVLPYVAQQAVEQYSWLTEAQMMSGLGLAETTPGPLIIVLQFVGFLGGWQNPGSLSPLAAASIGALITTWVTFLPCFLFIFIGGPYVEQVGAVPVLRASFTAITAAVVGVIFSLAVKFSQFALWSPSEGVNWGIVVLSSVCLLALWRYKVSAITVILACGGFGLLSWSMA